MLLTISILFGTTMISMSLPSTTKLYIVPSKTEYWTPALNKTFMINVSIANVSDLKGFEFKLFWNTTLLDLVDVDIQPFLNQPVNILINETREDLGRYWLGAWSQGNPKSGSGALATLSFKITYEPVVPENVTSVLDLADTKLMNSNVQPIPHEAYDGEYLCYSTPPLRITLMTDKPSYFLSDSIHIYGNLTLGFSPVQDGIVALEVDNPLNQIKVIRSLLTGAPPADHIVEIISVVPCNKEGNPRNWFYKGITAYFNVTIKNSDNKTRWVLTSVNLYYAENTPFGMDAFGQAIAANSTAWFQLSFPIPDTAPIGIAWVYANALTNWPRDGGTAYCPEKSATFEIRSISGVATIPPPQTSSSSPEGTYNLTFKLPPGEGRGNYTVYANSEYTMHEQTQMATKSITFEVKGFEGDLNGDGGVDIFDVVIAAAAFGSRPGDPNWDARADLRPEFGLIDIFDFMVVAADFGKGT